MIAFAVVLGLVTGNFLYQAFLSSPDYHSAMDRSFFQFVAVMAYVGLVAAFGQKS